MLLWLNFAVLIDAHAWPQWDVWLLPFFLGAMWAASTRRWMLAGFVFALAVWEWVAITFCIGLVLSAECMNTALERLADRVSLETHPLIKHAKDCGSAAVLVVALMSAVVGGLVFVPKLLAVAGW